MDKLLYVAMSGASNMMTAQATHSNNLANVDTQGFKEDFVQARSMPMFGPGYGSRVYAETEQPGTNFAPGVLKQTDNPLDLAIKNDGFFTVVDAQGQETFTRDGGFFVDVNGFMRNNNGDIVMGNAGPMIIPPYESIVVGADGGVSIRPLGQGAETIVQVDRIKLVNPPITELSKGEDGLFRRKDGLYEPPAADVEVVGGFLEGSNVNPVHSLLSIMSLSRQFEMSMKVMKEAEEMDQSTDRLIRAS
ncbi:MAG TPA: flagellar biosynthesis protein FlgF [Gammaproteobacteria bacterium]|nr:flagellar biosynthesis protein FlgF [Gammaproteobacteria bacterium]MEC8009170.1 flagellar basal body rod protein FlgF [Pseudomonadota bacterium]HBF08380.1 flagellar biosynthesis protein FlgF [Gammaproteobacteria bacterium]HCK91626.1 flagellar biosynthesis protein FlgF [Gammaproteobacteria bacterium]|tara:strand:+ start:93 stop:833 length:741 start_codon:yes stop_codon:yes gene_type:complete